MHYSNAKLGSDVNIDLDVSLRVHYGDQYRCDWQKAHVSGRRFQGDAAHSCIKRCKIILKKETLHFISDNKTGSGLMLNIKWLCCFVFFLVHKKIFDISHWEVSKTSELKKKSWLYFPSFVMWNTFAVVWDLFGCLHKLALPRCSSRFQ